MIGIQRDTQLEHALSLGEQPSVLESLAATKPGVELSEPFLLFRRLVEDPLPGLDHAGSHLFGELMMLIGEVWIEPIVSQQAVDGYDEKMRPVLARKPLEQAADNYAALLLLYQLFGPISIGAVP